tara:strand:+ start:336 stop:1481 length:1146 start_codon:yes stop_codon:yes gene_type:complete
MKKLIFKNLIKDILVFFLLISLSMTLIVWVMQAVNYLDIVSEDGHGFKVYFMFTIFSIPKLYSKLILFLYFISIFYIISKYQNNNEILIFWSHGIKKQEFINVIMQFSILIILFQLFINTYVAPRTQDIARNYLRSSNIDYFPSLIGQKKFIDTVKNLTIFIDEKDENGFLYRIFIKDSFGEDKSKIISAEKGIIRKKNDEYVLNLLNGTIANIDKKKTNILLFSRTEIDLSEYGTKTVTDAKVQELDTFQMINCLNKYYKHNEQYKIKSKYSSSNFECHDGAVDDYYKEIYKRVLIPFYILITSLLASTLILRNRNDIKYDKYKISVFLFGILLILFTEISNSYASYESKFNMLLLALPFILILSLYTLIIKANRKALND